MLFRIKLCHYLTKLSRLISLLVSKCKNGSRSKRIGNQSKGKLKMKKIDGLSPLAQRAITLIRAIPKGKVLTYSEVAKLIGATGCARHISYILSSSTKKHRLPWHRVVNSQGGISLPVSSGYFTQLELLKKEDVLLKNDKVQLNQFLWRPKDSELKKLLKGLPKHVPLKAKS